MKFKDLKPGMTIKQGVVKEIVRGAYVKSANEHVFYYSKKELLQAPPDQTPVLARDRGRWLRRVSTGKLDKKGRLLCYCYGKSNGDFTPWAQWKTI